MSSPSDTSGHATRMIEAFERRFAQLAPRHPAMVDAMAESSLTRRPGEVKISLYPPSEHGPGLLVTVNDDMPYLVDTVLLCLRRLECRFGRTLHPVVPIKRDPDGLALSMSGNRVDSLICVELLDEPEPEALRAMLDTSLRSVQVAVQAEPSIRQKMTTLSQAIPDSAWEIKTFISWLMEGHFLPLGLSIWKQAGASPAEQAQAFGLARHEEWPEIAELVEAALNGPEPTPALCVTKLARPSPVVRDSLCDAVLLRIDDEAGTRLAVLSGLFDPPLASIAAREIPYLRRKVARTIEIAGVIPLSHDEKHLRRIVEILPREALFMDDVEGILRRARAILEREETPIPCCFTSRLPCSPLTSALVLIPKGRFHPELEAPVGTILETRLGGRVLSHLVQVDEYGHARLQAHLLGAEPSPAALADVESALASLLRSWDDDLDEALAALGGPDGYWQARYWGAFPPSYRAAFTATDAVADIAFLDRALATGKPVPRFDRRGLTLFSPGGPVPLSAVLPVAEGVGLRSLSQSSHVISLPREPDIWVQIFEMEADIRLVEDDGLWRDITEVFEAVGDGRLESDSLNALVITARLSWREVALVRTIARYLRQVENSLSMVHMGRVLNRNGAFVRALMDAFHARLDPRGTAMADTWQTNLAERQAAITDGEDDRICEFFRLVVMAVLRTNYYRTDGGNGLDRISLKLNSGALPFLPQPVPFIETWVYSPRVEGIHLRGGPVARGGLRWSDRPDDFRTEILARVFRGDMDEHGTTHSEAAGSSGMREGVAMAIDLDGRRLIVLGISGPLSEVWPVARIIRFCVSSLLSLHHRDHKTRFQQQGERRLELILDQASETITHALTRLRDAVDNIDQGIALFDARQRLMVWNRRYLELSGFPEDFVHQGLELGRIFRWLAERGEYGSVDVEAIVAEKMALAACGRPHRFERVRPNGTVLEIVGRPTAQGGLVRTYSDVTANRHAVDALRAANLKAEQLAYSDPLTGLPNRRLLIDRLGQAVARSDRVRDLGALLFIDLDNFKDLNDTLGHDKGDQLLEQIGTRLSGCVRECDTVARVGGDEFVVLLENLSTEALQASTGIEMVGQKILAALSLPYLLGGSTFHTTASIGATIFGNGVGTVEELLKQADLAMYQAKTGGGNAFRFFYPEMQVVVANRVSLAEDLRQGLERGQFHLDYQPQTDGAGRITGAEALARWNHPGRGMVSPAEFIPVAEETGAIVALGKWVLGTACRQLSRWSASPATSRLTMAVNVSIRQFRQKSFVADVLETLARETADPCRLKLELTESLLMDDVEDVIAKMNALKAHGISFSLDDFGTGYSSLAYLKRLPLDQLKIDQSFVRDMLTEPNNAAIARTVVALAGNLGLDVIAEGVEERAQAEFLSSHGCHAYQGYLFSRPLSGEDFSRYVDGLTRQGASN
jgi:diguanylate cyclase (GGDEF)-like protein